MKRLADYAKAVALDAILVVKDILIIEKNEIMILN